MSIIIYSVMCKVYFIRTFNIVIDLVNAPSFLVFKITLSLI